MTNLLDSRHECVADIRHEIHAFSERDRKDLKEFIIAAISDQSILRNKELRIGLVKIIIALLPESEEILIEILKRHNSNLDFEFHFSLFCFIDQIQELHIGHDYEQHISNIVEAYLCDVKKSTAQAAWMAGDLLGNHWNRQLSLPILLRISEKAKYTAGKKAALYGLYMICKNDKSSEALEAIMKLTATKQKGVSSYAMFLLEKLASTTKTQNPENEK
jgi:hypothetical protein